MSKSESYETVQCDEPLLNDENFRFTVKPINPRFEIFWKLYKKQQESFWTAEEIQFTHDYHDFLTLSEDQQHYIKMILAFFAASDGIVNFNLREYFLREIKPVEAQIAYGYQLMMENIHGEVYSDMLLNIVKDDKERDFLFNAISTVPSVKMMTDWIFKWIKSDTSIGYRIIAMSIVEGVFFSGAFCSIFWFKKYVATGPEFMKGLVGSNEFIARDEGLHVNFACALYSYIKNKVSSDDVYDMFREANEIVKVFNTDSIPCRLIGMDADLLTQYVQYIADRLLVSLGYEKMWMVTNPFNFMESIGMLSKANFFEKRPTDYQKAHNEDNKHDWDFEICDDF